LKLILTAHQPVYLPWLGLFHKIAMADRFISFDQVQYLPKDWNSRNRVKTANGPAWMTVPVKRKGHLEKTISEIEIDNVQPWQRKHLKTLQIAYKKTPYFDKYIGFFEDTYSQNWERLVDLNAYMLDWFLDTLGIDCPVDSAGKFDFQGAKNDLVLDMCVKLQTETYIFGALGRNYADEKAFAEAGIKVAYQDYQHPTYPQLHGGFEGHLSIVDLLFNCGDDSYEILMSDNLGREELRSNFQATK
jgi:hypothetical protein